MEELDIPELSVVVSLVCPAESSLNYDPLLIEAEWVGIPVRDYEAPSMEDLQRFVRIVDRAAGTVVVHCQGGCGRTGTFGAAWLIYSTGCTAAQAVKMLRRENPGAVETAEQMAVLGSFERSERGPA
jgi:protein-tyrosine phosphatase